MNYELFEYQVLTKRKYTDIQSFIKRFVENSLKMFKNIEPNKT